MAPTDLAGNGAPAAQPPQPPPGAAAPIQINFQYVKDLSFEVPGAPDVFLELQQKQVQPQINTQLDVNARQIRDGAFEVSLLVEISASGSDKPVFALELDYRGIFTLTGVPDEMLEMVLLVECPRQLFPFARAIVADATREGGFMPLMMPLIDFFALYQSRRAQAGQPPAEPPGPTV